ncbi:glycosyltransferase family 2 protein [Granulicella cerasi]|uniref:Glycosyltransferase family 2 protein n=1 Tax=Granulicella cerasi TaxID=741063 RepID=A0ABW1Z9S6_9BACT|nr:glycosyltransferase [Granulicella cerasi]
MISSSDTTRADISIVMATCSRAPQLREALASLFAQQDLDDVKIEMVIVDDQSTDNTAEMLAELAQHARFPMRLLRGEKRGVAAARNLAASNAAGTWLASFDDDEIAEPDWLVQLYRCALQHDADCVGGSTLLRLPAPHIAAHYGTRARRLLGETLPGGSTRIYPQRQLPATNNALMRREMFLSLGGYDERFTEGGEDTDFFLRARNADFCLWLEPSAIAHHVIPERRTSIASIEQTAMRIGVAEARITELREPATRAWATILSRSMLGLLRDLPQLIAARITRRQLNATDARLSLLYTLGFTRATVSRGARRDALRSRMDFRMRHGERDDPTRR